jgi:acetylornithine deacetylase/succinyl-diaminopimelate desuccinylase-like protein
MAIHQAINYAAERQQAFIQEIIQLCAIPSVSASSEHKDDVLKAANWLADKLRAIGIEQVAIMETGGNPIVYGEKKSKLSNAKTVLLYGHYDVQPAEKETLAFWKTPPFVPTIIGENLYARGATDMKGQIMAGVHAIEAYLTAGEPLLNFKFLLEGEEEISSSHLEEFIATHKELLSCDIFLNLDAGMISSTTPTITYGLRGLALFELTVYGPKNDLHSGSFGGTVHNPAKALCELITAMHDENHQVALPGFYNRVRPLDEEERRELARLPQDEGYFIEQTGVPKLWGEPNYSPIERVSARPTLEINGLYSGYIGEGTKTVLPAYAMAKISTRLVPDQIPEEVHQQMRAFLEAKAPPTITWKLQYLGGNPATLSPRSSPALQALTKAFEWTWGKKPYYKREGGSIPVILYAQEILKADVVNSGFSLPEDNMHGPNEKLHLPTWQKGVQTLIYFFDILGEG